MRVFGFAGILDVLPAIPHRNSSGLLGLGATYGMDYTEDVGGA